MQELARGQPTRRQHGGGWLGMTLMWKQDREAWADIRDAAMQAPQMG